MPEAGVRRYWDPTSEQPPAGRPSFEGQSLDRQAQAGGCLPGQSGDTLHSGGGSSGLPGQQGQRAWREPWGPWLTEAPLSHSIRSVMQKYLEDRGEVTFEKIFSQKLGEYIRNSASPEDFHHHPAAQALGGGGQEDPEAAFLPPARWSASVPLSLEVWPPFLWGRAAESILSPRVAGGLLRAMTRRASQPLAVGCGSPVKGVGAQQSSRAAGEVPPWGFCF